MRDSEAEVPFERIEVAIIVKERKAPHRGWPKCAGNFELTLSRFWQRFLRQDRMGHSYQHHGFSSESCVQNYFDSDFPNLANSCTVLGSG